MLFGAIYCEVSCSFCVFIRDLYGITHFFLSVKIDCTLDKYLCIVKLKNVWLWDYLISFYLVLL